MVKKILACFLVLVCLAGCSLPGGNKENIPEGMKFDPTSAESYTLDVVGAMGEGKALGMLEERKESAEVKKAAEDLLKKIEQNPDTVTAKEGGKNIYVSNSGDDGNDGLSPETAIASLTKAMGMARSGDAVLLERGGFWRGTIVGKNGVSIGAYGEGNKPTVYGSVDGTKLEWVQSEENENIWVADVGVSSDIGLVVFDNGKAFGNRKGSLEAVVKNFNFFFKSRGTELYLYYDKGNPAEDFYAIEICNYNTILEPKSNSTIQNLRLMYTGGYGVWAHGGIENLKIQGLIMGYMGGGCKPNGSTTRYGNAIELWGRGNGFYVDLCHIFQAYDAGVTFQWNSEGAGGDVSQENIAFTNNLLEYSVYNFEYFLRNSSGALRNIEVSGNVMRCAGYGWGRLSRPDKSTPANIKGGATSVVENFVVKDNVFSHGVPALISITNKSTEQDAVFSGNTYVVNKSNELFSIKYGTKTTTYKASDCIGKTAEEIFGDKTGKITIY